MPQACRPPPSISGLTCEAVRLTSTTATASRRAYSAAISPNPFQVPGAPRATQIHPTYPPAVGEAFQTMSPEDRVVCPESFELV